MKNTNRLFVDQSFVLNDEKPDLLQLADQAEREGWIDTSCQFALALCLMVSLVICGVRAAAPSSTGSVQKTEAAAVSTAVPATLAVGAVEAKAAPAL